MYCIKLFRYGRHCDLLWWLHKKHGRPSYLCSRSWCYSIREWLWYYITVLSSYKFGNPMSKSLCHPKIFPQRFENNDGNSDSSFMFVLYARGCVAKITKIPQRDHMLWRFHYNTYDSLEVSFRTELFDHSKSTISRNLFLFHPNFIVILVHVKTGTNNSLWNNIASISHSN